jgi:hypothetical protein
MNEQRQIEEMAKIEGVEVWHCPSPSTGHHGLYKMTGEALPDYLTSHDACQRVIDGLEQGYCDFKYSIELMVTIIRDNCLLDDDDEFIVVMMLKATPAQKVEAILKAKGVWE